MQEPQPLGDNFTEEKIDARCVAAGPGEAGDKPEPDGVFAQSEYDRDRWGRRFGRKGNGGAARRGDDCHLAADEIRHERRQTIETAVEPVILDRHALPLDVAVFAEAFTKRSAQPRSVYRPKGADE